MCPRGGVLQKAPAAEEAETVTAIARGKTLPLAIFSISGFVHSSFLLLGGTPRGAHNCTCTEGL